MQVVAYIEREKIEVLSQSRLQLKFLGDLFGQTIRALRIHR